MGVIGHVDHGKTSLVRALTGMDTDRLPEERRRGVSIALGFAHLDLGEDGGDGREVDLIDMPGHERFVRTMVSGATGVGAALLVVAADEGVKPQTREHVDIAALLGVRRAVVAITKRDRADPAAAAAEASALLARAGLEAEAPVAVSVLTGEGLGELRGALARAADAAEAAADDGWPWLPLDRAFHVGGHGVVVTGTLRRGRLARGDELELLPSGRRVRVRGLQVHGRAVEAASPGQRTAVNLRGVELADAGRGSALASPGLLRPASWLTVRLAVPPDAPELRHGARLQLLSGTAETPVRLRLLEGDTIAPGASGLAQLHAAEPVAAPARARFILRLPSPAATVAGGRVLDPAAHRLRRGSAAEAAWLARLAEADAAGVVRLALERAGPAGAPLARLAELAGVAPGRVSQALRGLAAERVRGDAAVLREALEAVGVAVAEALQTRPATVAALAARTCAGAEVLDEALALHAAAGRVRVEGGSVRWLHAREELARADAEAAAAARLADALRRGGLQPPDAPGPEAPRELRRALDRLVREHVAVRTHDRVQKREVVFHRDAVDAARAALRPHLAGEGLLVKEAGAILGVSRKFSVPLLEHLDAVGFTRRVGDRRVLGAAAAG